MTASLQRPGAISQPQYSESEYFQQADNLLTGCCHLLQKIFLQRWTLVTGQQWTEGKTGSAQQLIWIHIPQLYSTMKPLQKASIEKGCVKEWDITLLSQLLLRGTLIARDEDRKRAKAEDTSIRTITHIRNKLSHNASKTLSLEEYSKFKQELCAQVRALGDSEADVQKMVQLAEITASTKAVDLANKLQSEGDHCHNNLQDFRNAIQLYTEALALPSTPVFKLSQLFQKRGASYFALAEKSDEQKSINLDLSEKDALKSIELDSNSWKGHQLLGLVHKSREKLTEAVKHLQLALAINPGSCDLKGELDGLKHLLWVRDRGDHLEPMNLPTTLTEHIQEVNSRLGANLSEATFLKLGKAREKLEPGSEAAFQGERYAKGWKVEQSYSEAARYYLKAANLGNARGMYHLALLYKDGLGVRQDVGKAVELLEKAVKLPIKRKNSVMEVNLGVLESHHVLGLMHMEGIGYPKNYSKAAYHFRQAAQFQHGNAANNLACLYSRGNGVPKDDKQAEFYWKEAVRQKSKRAAASLHVYYLEQLEPELGKMYLDIAIQLGNEFLEKVRPELMQKIELILEERKEIEVKVEGFERRRKLDKKGLTLLERLERMTLIQKPEAIQVLKSFKEIQAAKTNGHSNWAGRMKAWDLEELVWKAEFGSVTAKRLVDAMEANVRFIHLWGRGPPFPPERLEELLEALYRSLSGASQFLSLPPWVAANLFGFLEKLLHSPITSPGNAGNLDKYVRYCYCSLCLGNLDSIHVELMKEGLKRYPEEPQYHQRLGDFYGFLGKHSLGVKTCDIALVLFPNNPELLYIRATHLRNLIGDTERELEEIRDAHLKFIESAPSDHRMLPEVYYCLGVTYIPQHGKLTPQKKGMMTYYYQLGEEAEKLQLSCYLPYDAGSKMLLKPYIADFQTEPEVKLPIGKEEKEEEEEVVRLSAPGPQLPKLEENKGMDGPTSKVYLKDPRRIGIILKHRGTIQKFRGLPGNSLSVNMTKPPKFKQKMPETVDRMKSINLNQMDPTQDKVYVGRLLTLRIIEEPLFGFASVQFVAEDDETGEATWFYIYNIPQNEETRERFGSGVRLSVINPYMRIAADGSHGIRVDDPKCLIELGKVEDMCAYCGDPKAPKRCAKCKKVRYCGKQCQEMDWKVLKHKLVCSS